MNVCLRCGDEFSGTGILCSKCIAEVVAKEEIRENYKRIAVEQTKKTCNEFRERGLLNVAINVFSIILQFI